MSCEAKGETSASWRGGVVVPEERWRRETSAKVEYILVGMVEVLVTVEKVVVENKMRLSRKTFGDFLVIRFFSTDYWRGQERDKLDICSHRIQMPVFPSILSDRPADRN